MELLLHGLFIFVARIVDVSLGTLRTLAVVNGRRLSAWLLGVVEIMIWVMVAAKVLPSVRENPIYAFFYATGFATGGYVGMTIEHWLGRGERILMLFSRHGAELASALRDEHIVTEWQGRGHEGEITILFLKLPRRQLRRVVSEAKTLDPDCFYTVERVDSPFDLKATLVPRTGWRAAARKGK